MPALCESTLMHCKDNGDTDPGINSFVSQNWTSSLGFDEEEEWRPWTLDGKEEVAGYVTRYAGDFDFATIRGSGHMVVGACEKYAQNRIPGGGWNSHKASSLSTQSARVSAKSILRAHAALVKWRGMAKVRQARLKKAGDTDCSERH